jgi:RNA polymerase sigma-70 factor (ECF subfamily)
MKLRQQNRRNEVNIDDLMPLFDQNECRREPHWSEIKTPEIILREFQNTQQVLNCIEQLPSDYRVVLLLRDIEELNTKEVAKMLDCTESTVKVRLHRARCALKKLLEPMMCQEGKS